MLHSLLPLISIMVGSSAPIPAAGPAPAERPRTAQVRLAEALAEADAIFAVTVRGAAITFELEREGHAYDVVVATRPRRGGAIVALEVHDLGAAHGVPNSLGWLGDELADATAVTSVSADDDGAVTLTTSDGRAYMVIPGRGSGGNTAVEARWAATWSATSGA